MKKIYLLLLVLFTAVIYSQTKGITYQAVILNPEGEHIPGYNNERSQCSNKDICLRFSIYKGTILEYQETKNTTTDEFGMVNVIIGSGIYISGESNTLSGVDWDGNAKNLVVEVDIKGTCSYFSEISNQPFTYVPYAFYAENSGTPGPAGPQGEAGSNGNNGLSAFQVAVANGYSGTEAQWLATLVGPAGTKGATGTFQNGNNIGDVLYWNGTSWTILPIGIEGQNLTICSGIPHWGGCNSTTPVATISSITSCNTASTGSLYAGSSASGVTQTITLVVATVGTYNISTSANGVTFSASGTFTNTGSQNVVLLGNGTPNTTGPFYYTLNTTPSCTFQISTLSQSSVSGLTDIDGNVYNNVDICGKLWLQKNLNVSRYRNGDPIPQIIDPTEWASATYGAWCYLQNNPAVGNGINGSVYGKLYNWFAVNDPRGLAPQGYHVATWTELDELVNCLGGYSVAGGKLKEAGTTHWLAPNTGATNSSGFTALPTGQGLEFNNQTSGIGTAGQIWSSTEYSGLTSNAHALQILYATESCGSNVTGKHKGYGVRCVKD